MLPMPVMPDALPIKKKQKNSIITFYMLTATQM